MRACSMILVVLVCSVLVGCQAIEQALNPMPTTEGSRISEKLRSIPPPDPAKVKTVTVYRFKNSVGFVHGLTLTQGMTDQLVTALVKTGHFKVVERDRLNEILTEKNLQRTGEATGTAGTTKLAGADLIFAGAVTEFDQKGGGGVRLGYHGHRLGVNMFRAQVGIDMRVYDPGTGVVKDSIDVRREVRKTGFRVGYRWRFGANFRMSNAMDLAVREVIEEAVYQLVMRYGAG